VNTGYRKKDLFASEDISKQETSLEKISELRIREAYDLFKEIWLLRRSDTKPPIETIQSIPSILDRLYGLQYIPDSSMMVDFIFESIRGLITRITWFFLECKGINALPEGHPYAIEGAGLGWRIEERLSVDRIEDRFSVDRRLARLRLESRCVSTERNPDLAKKVDEWIKTGEFGIGLDENPLNELIEELKKWYCSTVDGPMGTSMNRYKRKCELYSTAHYNRDVENKKLAVKCPYALYRTSDNSLSSLNEVSLNSDCQLLTIRLWLAHHSWKIADLMQTRIAEVYPLVQMIMSVTPLFPSCAFNAELFNTGLRHREKASPSDYSNIMDLIADGGISLDRYIEEHAFHNWDESLVGGGHVRSVRRDLCQLFIDAQARVKTRTGRHLLLMKTIIKLQRGIDIPYALLGMISDMAIKIG